MKIIFGIGNPGLEYAFTRHNVGFIILDNYALLRDLKFIPSKKDYYFAEGNANSNKFLLVKPSTYVNNSGIAAKDVIEEYNINLNDFLVVSDDINLAPGDIRIRKSGGDGGHNGIASIIYHLYTDRFPRLRFGIGNDFDFGKKADYVLSKFDEKTFEELKPKIKFCMDLLDAFILGGINNMLDCYSKHKSQNTKN